MQSASDTLLIVAHPGHEILVWSWLERVRPRVMIFTDGSGASGQSRIESTRRLLINGGAMPGTMFGDFADQTIYQATLLQQNDFFERMVYRVAQEIIEYEIRTVVGDSAEGMIMAHDLLREVRRAAVRIAESELGWSIEQFDYPLDSHPTACPAGFVEQQVRIKLSDQSLQRKLAVARSYPEIRTFVDAAIKAYGEHAFAVETMFPTSDRSLLPEVGQTLRYELHGEEMVRQAKYRQVIRYDQHVRPIISRLESIAAPHLAYGL